MRLSLCVFLFALLWTAGCGREAAVNTYFPAEIGNSWIYGASAGEEDRLVSVKVRSLDKVSGTPCYRMGYYVNSGVQPLQDEFYAVKSDGVYKLKTAWSSREAVYDPPLMVLPADPSAHSSWQWQGKADGREMTLSCSARSGVSVDAGGETYGDCIRVEMKAGDGGTVTRWYAAGKGLVREETSRAQGGELALELRESVLITRTAP